jgi:predicted SprT family Zn-dependent metalloprotease
MKVKLCCEKNNRIYYKKEVEVGSIYYCKHCNFQLFVENVGGN